MIDNANLDKKVFVRDLKDKFNLIQLTGNEDSLNRWIVAPDVNRPGLELTGYMRLNDLKRVTIIGTKELEFLATLDYDTQYARFGIITDAYTPCIVITKSQPIPEALKKIAIERNFPIFHTSEETARISVEIMAFLDEKLAPCQVFHGVMMNIYGIGVLLKGESGIGKSELALDLVRRGHMLVADDCVEIYRVHNDLTCKAPELLKNMLEIRGIGVIDMTLVYGAVSCLDACNLDFVIELRSFSDQQNIERQGLGATETIDIMGLEKPLIIVPVREGRALSVIIEAAVANFRLLQKGTDSAKEFHERLQALIEKNEKGEIQ